MNARAFYTIICLATSTAVAHDWHSTDGRSLAASFVRLSGDTLTLRTANGKAVALPLATLSAEDQAYARSAQTLAEGALKLGPQLFECSASFGDGALCKLGNKMANGIEIFTGEQFYLITDAANVPAKGAHLKDQVLFFAGQRTLHPLQGVAMPVRCFATTIDQAMSAAASTADIYEPMIEQMELRGLGYPIGNNGLVLVDRKLVATATSIVVDIGKDLQSGTVLITSNDLGIAVVQAKAELTAMHLAPRKSLEIGQPVTLLSLKPGQYAKSLEAPVVTEGTITGLSAPNGPLYFEHNAPRDPEAIGGLVLSAKGDVIGIMTENTVVKRGTSKDAVLTRLPMNSDHTQTALRTEAIIPFLKTIPKVTAAHSPSSDDKDLRSSLHKAAVMVRVVRETRKDMSPAAVAAASAEAAKDPNALRYSISKGGTRHNSTCANFNPKALCKPTDGTPCKKCGG